MSELRCLLHTPLFASLPPQKKTTTQNDLRGRLIEYDKNYGLSISFTTSCTNFVKAV